VGVRLDGRLLGAPAMERTAGFVKSEWGLPNLLVEEWLGFLFVNFDRAAQPLAPTLAAYEPYLQHYDLSNAASPGSFTLTDLPWNWKVMFENFNDGYHANAAPHDSRLLPQQPRRVPSAVGRIVERDLPHQRIHAHRWWVQRRRRRRCCRCSPTSRRRSGGDRRSR
jgi:phenylpropionate dioxygenase-like ring-hydroxylating dioxygenase large terminal subunit